MAQYFFKTPFASEGDREDVPRTAQTSGAISYAQGWGPDYEKPLNTQASAKPVSRKATNQTLYDLTLSVGQYQRNGAPDYITSADNDGQPYSYMTGATVIYNGVYYVSTRDNNTNAPTGAGWQPVAYRVATQDETNKGTGAQLIVTPPTLKVVLDAMKQSNETDLSKIRQDIGTNKQNIETNRQNIDTNKQNIETNRQNIQTNAQNIDKLRDDVTPYLVPVGTIIMWGTQNVPDGWLEINGQGISQSSDPQLYALYGANLPDFRGYFPRAKDDSRQVLSKQDGQAPRSSFADKYDANSGPDGWYSHAALDSGYKVQTGTDNDGTSTVRYESEDQRETRPKNVALYFIIKRG